MWYIMARRRDTRLIYLAAEPDDPAEDEWVGEEYLGYVDGESDAQDEVLAGPFTTREEALENSAAHVDG